MTVAGVWRLWLALMAAMLVWLVWAPPVQEAGSAGSAAAPRKPPGPPQVPATPPDPGPALETLSTSTLWGPRAARPAVAASAAASAPEPVWLTSGTVRRGNERLLIVHFEGNSQPSQLLRVGDSLPDGSRIEKIETNRVLTMPPRLKGARAPRAVWRAVVPGVSLSEP